jgi:predicted HD phosphohydrolase
MCRQKDISPFRYPEYYNKLSEASKITLDKQGGRMNDAEAKQFESDNLYLLFIKIREWDDKAKIERIPLPSLEIYKQMAFQHLMMQN